MNDWASRIGRHMTAEGSVVVPARIAAWLEQRAGLTSDRRIRLRDADPAAYEVLMALHAAALDHRSGTGTKHNAPQADSRYSKVWLTTTDTAPLLGVTDRAVRKWCASGRLPATKQGGRWLINRNHLQIAKLTA